MRNNGGVLDAFVDMLLAATAPRLIGTYYSTFSFWIAAFASKPMHWVTCHALRTRRHRRPTCPVGIADLHAPSASPTVLVTEARLQPFSRSGALRNCLYS